MYFSVHEIQQVLYLEAEGYYSENLSLISNSCPFSALHTSAAAINTMPNYECKKILYPFLAEKTVFVQ